MKFVLVQELRTNQFKISYGSQHEQSTQSTPRSLRNSEVKRRYLRLHTVVVRTLGKSWFSERADCHSFGQMMLFKMAATAAPGAPTLVFSFFLFLFCDSPVRQHSGPHPPCPFLLFFIVFFFQCLPILVITHCTHKVRRLQLIPTRI